LLGALEETVGRYLAGGIARINQLQRPDLVVISD
jgi:hypothetical protein